MENITAGISLVSWTEEIGVYVSAVVVLNMGDQGTDRISGFVWVNQCKMAWDFTVITIAPCSGFAGAVIRSVLTMSMTGTTCPV